MVSGSSVDFPAPGGAVMTSELCVASMLFTRSAICAAGSWAHCLVMCCRFICLLLSICQCVMFFCRRNRRCLFLQSYYIFLTRLNIYADCKGYGLVPYHGCRTLVSQTKDARTPIEVRASSVCEKATSEVFLKVVCVAVARFRHAAVFQSKPSAQLRHTVAPQQSAVVLPGCGATCRSIPGSSSLWRVVPRTRDVPS